MQKYYYFNSKRLEGVGDWDWRVALDELTVYLTWRLRGTKTRWGAHSERELGVNALDYYTEEAAIKLIEGSWKWQERYTLGQQLIEIASNLITKQAEKYARKHPQHPIHKDHNLEDALLQGFFAHDGSILVDYVEEEEKEDETPDPRQVEVSVEDYPDVMDDDEAEELDETYAMVMSLVADDHELTLYVEAIHACGHFHELPEYLGISMQHVYRLQEKLMRRLRRARQLREMMLAAMENQSNNEY